MSDWIRYYKTLNGELLAEDYMKNKDWLTSDRIQEDFEDWVKCVKWVKDPPSTEYECEFVDLPSVEWLQNNIDRNNKDIKHIQVETQDFKEMLYKHTRGYKVETIIEKIKE